MKNELGRKITSLTLMTIMFAGGITVAGASFMPMAEMPEAIASHGTSSGALSVSSTHIMGGAVLAITVSDPSIAATDQAITAPSVDLDGQSIDMTQASDGSWVAYVVDHETAINLQGAFSENSNSSGFEYGILCDAGLGAQAGADVGGGSALGGLADNDVTTNPSFYEGWDREGKGTTDAGCQDTVDTKLGPTNSLTGQTKFSVLESPASLNTNSGTGANNSGNRNIVVNSTNGFSSAWPFIQALNFSSTMATTYGSESVDVEWGNQRDYSIAVDRTIIPDNAAIQVTVTDPGLNYDPTSADVWIMDAQNEQLYFWNNGSVGDDTGATHIVGQDSGSNIDSLQISFDGTQNGVLSTTSLGYVCSDDCTMSVGGSPKKVLGITGQNAYGWMNVTLTETANNSGVFEATLVSGTEGHSGSDGASDSSMTLTYGNTVSLIVGYNDATISLEAGDAWLPVETADFTLTDPDANKDTSSAETLDISDPYDRIPTITVGDPLTLGDNVQTKNSSGGSSGDGGAAASESSALANQGVTAATQGGGKDTRNWYNTQWANTSDNSKRLMVIVDGISNALETAPEEASNTTTWVNVTTGIAPSQLVDMSGTVLVSYDVTSLADALGSTDINVVLTHGTPGAGMNATVHASSGGDARAICLEGSGNVKAQVVDLDELTGGDSCGVGTLAGTESSVQRVGVDGIEDVWGSALQSNYVSFAFEFTHPIKAHLANNGTCSSQDCYGEHAIAVDIMNFDQDNATKVHNGIYRIEAVETGANTGVFTGTVAYALMNNSTDQEIGSGDPGGSSGFTTGGHSGNPSFVSGNSDPGITPTVSGSDIVILLGDDGDSPRVSYNDSDVTAAGTIIAAQLDVTAHSGTAEFDSISYGDGDTATITITDIDLNQDSSVRETYTNSSGTFQVMINDDDSQVSADQVVIETGADTGVFVGSFVVPSKLGNDMELQYYDSVDATGGDSTIYGVSTIASNTGSVSFDQTTYPVPYVVNGLDEGDNTVMSTPLGAVTVTIAITEPDNSNDTLTTGSAGNSLTAGTIKVKLSGAYVFTAGGQVAVNSTSTAVKELGPLDETERGSQIYEVDFELTPEACHGGSSNTGACQEGLTNGASLVPMNSTSIMQVEYVDTADAAGGSTTLYDSAIFALHTGQLSVDKDVYIMGQDAVITLTDADLNRDSGTSEQYDLRLIEWDSSANSSVLLHNSYCTTGCTLDPSNLTETGDNTGVFQTVFTIPTSIAEQSGTATSPEMGEEVTLTYRDRGLSGEKSYGDDELDIEAGFSISKFGAIVELDKAVYDWTDTVVVTITAPDHNNNANNEETIGTSSLPIQASTRAGKMCTTGDKTYTLNESDEDTGVFTGEFALRGFDHTMATSQSYTASTTEACTGNTSGELSTAGNMDGVTVSYEWVDGSVAIASAIVQWNIGEVEIVDSTVSPNGSTVIRVTDVDEDVSSTVIDTFKVDVFSDSDSGGFQATVSETGEGTGVFEGTIHFADDAATSGLTLRVAEGDTVTVEYTDVTLPGPDYTTADDLTIAATATVGTTTPPLERAPAANARVVDAFGSSVAEVSVDQQVQIAADVANSQGKEQAFAYLVQVQDSNGVTVSLAWITGSLNAGQSMSPALSWTPSTSGSYTATVFVWESVDNPVALSPTVSVGIDVV